jgi:hypothetical protein
LDPVESKIYNVRDSEVFSSLVDGQMLELLRNYRAENDPEFKIFIEDLMKIREGEKIDISTYGNKKCRKSLCWTNPTREAINTEWMLKESQNQQFITLNNIRIFIGLPLISNKTRMLSDVEIKNNEEFEVEDFDKDTITLKSTDRQLSITFDINEFKNFDLAYCLTVHKAQGSTFKWEYSIYEHHLFDQKLLYTAMSRSTEKNFINFVKIYYKTYKGYIYKIENKKTNKVYIGSTKTSIQQRFKEHIECKDTSPLHKDMRKYGCNNFKIEVIKKLYTQMKKCY